MPHFGQDVRQAFDRKVIRAGNAAYGAYVRCGCWSADHLTEGFIPIEIARKIATVAQIRKLLGAGLLSELDGGYQMDERVADGNQ